MYLKWSDQLTIWNRENIWEIFYESGSNIHSRVGFPIRSMKVGEKK